MAEARRGRSHWQWAAAAALMAAAAAALVYRSESLPAGPEPVAWDRQRCERCRMLVSERGFAAQLQNRDGAVLFFDDPGCLLLHVHEHAPPVHAIYFHHLREARWISAEAVGFVTAGPTPMGYGLGAVDAGTDGALPAAQALEQALARERERAGG